MQPVSFERHRFPPDVIRLARKLPVPQILEADFFQSSCVLPIIRSDHRAHAQPEAPTSPSIIPIAHPEHRLGGFRAGLDPDRAAAVNHLMTSSDHLMLI
jgi:hypothetical protein